MTTRTALYEHYHEGVLQYVGVSSNPSRRLAAHVKAGKWPISEVRLKWFDSRCLAERAERSLIENCSPIHNSRWKPADCSNAVHTNLLNGIYAAINAAGISKGEFGVRAAKDPRLVYDLEKGREVRRAMRTKIAAAVDALEARP